jgi:hypothetical protein
MKHKRFEIDPVLQANGAGWLLCLIGFNVETGEEVDMGSGIIPVTDDRSERDAHLTALQAGIQWVEQPYI